MPYSSNKRIVYYNKYYEFCLMEENFYYETITKAIKFIRENQIEQPTLDEIANHVHLSKFHLLCYTTATNPLTNAYWKQPTEN